MWVSADPMRGQRVVLAEDVPTATVVEPVVMAEDDRTATVLGPVVCAEVVRGPRCWSFADVAVDDRMGQVGAGCAW